MSRRIKEKLPKAFKKKWVAALRSGKYVQAEGYLYSEEKSMGGKLAMCCLGIAEHICGTPLNAFNIAAFPADLKQRPKSPKMIHSGNEGTIGKKLSEYNDGAYTVKNGKRSFNWIAAYIERYL